MAGSGKKEQDALGMSNEVVRPRCWLYCKGRTVEARARGACYTSFQSAPASHVASRHGPTHAHLRSPQHLPPPTYERNGPTQDPSRNHVNAWDPNARLSQNRRRQYLGSDSPVLDGPNRREATRTRSGLA